MRCLHQCLHYSNTSFMLGSTHDDSVLELFYKDLYQLYNLKNTLEAEGLDNYVIDHHRTERTNTNSLLH